MKQPLEALARMGCVITASPIIRTNINTHNLGNAFYIGPSWNRTACRFDYKLPDSADIETKKLQGEDVKTISINGKLYRLFPTYPSMNMELNGKESGFIELVPLDEYAAFYESFHSTLKGAE